ncbi:MAG TPA: hypothetical protein DC049_16820, partial [Spirochaetia bacterium]|nr:hypothetical protein [Spirochaetia bacterium]
MKNFFIFFCFSFFLFSGDQSWNIINTEPRIIPHSALDLSCLNETPAGRFGFVKAENGELVFEKRPGVPVKFYGANNNWNLNFLPHNYAESMAETYSRLGYNVLRLHSHDSMKEWSPGIFIYTNGILELNCVQLDKLEYLIAELKKRGIYIVIDVFHLIDFIHVPQLAEYAGSQESKILLQFLPEAYSHWQRAADLWLSHVNPYTGLALKNDPVVVSVSPWNEQHMGGTWGGERTGSTHKLKKFLLKDCNDYLAQKNLNRLDDIPFSIYDCKDPDAITRMVLYFSDRTLAVYEKMKNHLKSMGIKAPIAGFNYVSMYMVDYWRSFADAYETHLYFQYVKGRLPDNRGYRIHPYPRLSEVLGLASKIKGHINNYYPLLAAHQPFDKPFFLTEFQDCFPIKGREEAGLFVGAIGAYQGWDLANRFAFSFTQQPLEQLTSAVAPGTREQFDISGDPMLWLSEYTGSLCFRNNYITSPANSILIATGKDFALTGLPAANAWGYFEQFAYLPHLFRLQAAFIPSGKPALYYNRGNITREMISSGNLPASDRIPYEYNRSIDLKALAELCIKAGDNSEIKTRQLSWLAKNVLCSDTAELFYDISNSVFIIDTPFLYAASGNIAKIAVSSERVVFSTEADKGMFFCVSLDRKPLNESSRILLLFLTDIRAKNERTEDGENGTRLYFKGSLPVYTKYADAKISIQLNPDITYSCYTLAMSGKRIRTLPLDRQGKLTKLGIDTTDGFVFEITDGKESISY